MFNVESAMPTAASVAAGAKDAASESTAKSGETTVSVPDAAEPAVVKGTDPSSKGAAAAPVAAPPVYQPNFKFKIQDQEKEFDEWAKGAVKDAETEKKVRELYEKAHGLELVKEGRETLRGELAQTKEKMGKTDAALETLGNYVRGGDFDSFFEALKIPKANILKYALELVQREQNPELAARHESERHARMQTSQYEQQISELTAGQQELRTQQKEYELQAVMSRPDVVQVAEMYNTGAGNPGAFREYVIRIGQAFAAQGSDVSAEHAVTEAIRHLRAVNPQLGQVAAPTPGTPRVVQPNTAPVIPNIQGRGTSPVRSTMKSIDDLKKRQKELEAAGQ